MIKIFFFLFKLIEILKNITIIFFISKKINKYFTMMDEKMQMFFFYFFKVYF
jgi:hypothetical protein